MLKPSEDLNRARYKTPDVWLTITMITTQQNTENKLVFFSKPGPRGDC